MHTCIYVYMYIYIQYIYIYIGSPYSIQWTPPGITTALCAPSGIGDHDDLSLAFTRYAFTSRVLCTNQRSFSPPRPPALFTLVQYYCAIGGQYTTPLATLACVCDIPLVSNIM